MSELLGTQVGNIRIVDLLGRGGMGEVYAGFDIKLNRKVAVKSIRKDRRLDEETKARFLREARVLSKLEHPNICRIHEYIDGEDSDLLVLELIEGRSLTRAVREGLKRQEALEVAEKIAGVLAAAHEANVVHRDLKPENVMLTHEGTVKVLDFGISRSLEEEAVVTWKLEQGPLPTRFEPADLESSMESLDTEATVAGGSRSAPAYADTSAESEIRTQLGAVMGTVAYMSPEQARGEHVTAAADMYSFGLLLQEIFTGKPPMDLKLDNRELLERAAHGETAPISGLDKDLTTLINRLKATAPSARPTAAETVERLRWIHDRPRRRLRRLLVAAVVVAVLLSVAKYTFDVTRERNAALEARAAEEQARLEAEKVSDFLIDLFEVSDPGEARGNSVTARELLDQGADRIAGELAEQPRTRARLMITIGQVYRKLGLYDLAVPLLTEALEIREAELPEGHPEIAQSLDQLASLHARLGRYADAEQMYQEALAVFEANPPDDPLSEAKVFNNLALVYMRQGRHEEAEPLLQNGLRIKERELGSEDPGVAANLNNLGNLYLHLHRHDEAEVFYRRALLIREKHLPEDHPLLAMQLSNLAGVYFEIERFGEAERLYKRALAIVDKVYEPDHPEVARTINNLASLYIEQKRFAEAEPLLDRAVPIFEKVHGPQHPNVAVGLYNLGEVYLEQAKYADAEPCYRRSLAVFEASQGPESPLLAYPVLGLANVCRHTGRTAEAEQNFRRGLSLRENVLGTDDEDLQETVRDYAAFLRSVGRAAEADGLQARFTAAG